MKTVVVLLTLIFFANGKEEARIVGGEELDDISDYMFVVALVSKRGEFAGGGTLIDSRHVITAAHCWQGNGKVVVGSNDLISNGKEYSVKRFVSHPDYTTHRTIANDIAVIILSEDVSEITEFPKRPTAKLDDYDTSCKVLGKGVTGYPEPGTLSKKLKLAYVKPVPQSECRDKWKEWSSSFKVDDKTICTFSDDAAALMGDSGGPLLCDDKLTGVVSFGMPSGGGYPDVFTEVYFYNDWIDYVIKNY